MTAGPCSRRLFRLLLALALAACHGAATCMAEPAPQLDQTTTVARVNGIVITAGEVAHEVQTRPELEEQRTAAAQNATVAAALNGTVLSGVIDRVLLGTAARESGLVKGDTVAVELITRLMEYKTDEALAKAAEGRGISSAELLQRLKEDLIIDQYLKQVVTPPAITEDELKAFYDRLREGEEQNAKLRVRYLFAPAPGWQCSEAHSYAQRLIETGYDALKSGVEFYEVGDSRREATGPLLAGLILGVRRGTTPPEFDEQVFKAPLGALVPPFETSKGFFVLRVEDRDFRQLPPFDQFREELSHELKGRKRAEAIAQHLEKLRDAAKIDRGFENFLVSALPS